MVGRIFRSHSDRVVGSEKVVVLRTMPKDDDDIVAKVSDQKHG